jgi:6-phosphogluconate dehydrogenase
MRFGVVGLGRMGSNIARHAMEKGHTVVGFDEQEQARLRLAGEGLEPASSLADLVGRLSPPRVVLIYVPHGPVTEAVYEALRPLLQAGDVMVDGGNSHWADSQRRHAACAAVGVNFLDVGTSGGVAGARHGACFMAGGEHEAYALVEPLLRDLAVDDEGALHAGPAGAGHFSKLVHNAIEFGMVQAIAEGVELLRRSELELDLPALFNNWNHGSVIRGWLVELMAAALADNPDFERLSTYVEDTQEVKWVLAWALEQDIPTPVIGDSQQALMEYRDLDWPSAKAVALLRHAYGGHPVHEAGDPDARR